MDIISHDLVRLDFVTSKYHETTVKIMAKKLVLRKKLTLLKT